jgi:hypothetical protein
MIPRDKALHFGAGFLITLVVGFLTTPVVGFLAAFAAGVLKEIYDYYGQGEVFDPVDMIVTWAGGIIPLILLNVISQ